MGKSSGALWVSLGIKTSEFSKGLKRAKKDMNGFQKFGAGLKGMFNPLTIGLGAVAAVGSAFVDAAQRIKEFDSSVKSLSAITGATGKDLDFLKDKAIDLGSKTTLSSTQVVQGFEKIGSSMPKLLKSGEALSYVTEMAIRLAEAAKVDMATASQAVTLSMNQFGASADEAGKFVDILASGSKEGAGNVEFLSAAMAKVGGTAAKANLSFLDTAAAIETLAPVIETGEEAGTKFRNILVNMQKAGIGFASGQFNINDALKETKQKFDSIKDPIKKSGEMVDLFGKQNLAAGIQMLDNIDTFEEFQIAMDKNGVAAEQAKTNNDTLEGSLKRLDSAWEGFILGIEDGSGALSGVVRGFIDGITSMFDWIKTITESTTTWSDRFKMLANVVIDGINLMLTGFRGLASAVDKVFDTNIADALEIPKFEIGAEKVKEFSASLSDLSVAQAVINKSKITDKFIELGLTSEQAKKKVKTLIDAKRELVKVGGKVETTTDAQNNSTNKLTAAQEKLQAQLKKTYQEAERFTANDELFGTDEEEMSLDSFKIAPMPENALAGLEMPSFDEELEAEFAKSVETRKQKMAELAEKTQFYASTMAQAFSAVGGAIISAFGEADTAGKQFLLSMGKMVLDILAQALAASMANAITGATGAAAVAGPFAPAVLPATIATMIGSVVGAFAAIPAFANGGIVSGPTMGLMGEYQGARNNPEVITPLDKLQGMLNIGGGMEGNVNFRIEGTSLVGVLNRQGKSTKYSR